MLVPPGVALPPPWFEADLKAVLGRLELRWRPWTARAGDSNGDTIWSPFGPPLVRATTLDDEVVIKGQTMRLPGGNAQGWVAIDKDRVTSGRWVVYECFDGQDIKVFDVCDADSGPIPFDRRLLEACKECLQTVQERQQAIQAQYQEAELPIDNVLLGGQLQGGPCPQTVYRNPAQQQWRKDSEDQAKEVASYEYDRMFSSYQYDPPKEPKGEKHPAGFVITDRRRFAGAA